MAYSSKILKLIKYFNNHVQVISVNSVQVPPEAYREVTKNLEKSLGNKARHSLEQEISCEESTISKAGVFRNEIVI